MTMKLVDTEHLSPWELSLYSAYLIERACVVQEDKVILEWLTAEIFDELLRTGRIAG